LLEGALQNITKKQKERVFEFTAVVIDEETNLVNGFLTRLPKYGLLIAHIKALRRSGLQVARRRRKRWCMDIAYAFSNAHQEGMNMGLIVSRHNPSDRRRPCRLRWPWP
jgi:hypothetical protein